MLGAEDKVCTKAQIFGENCEWDGNKTCIKGFNEILEYPFQCECTLLRPTESRHVCNCIFPKSAC